MQCREPLATQIELLELREVGCDWIGDLEGYFAFGHYDPVAFIQTVNAQYDPDCPAEAHQARQEFWEEYSLEIDSDALCLRECKAEVEGALAVTYVALQR